MRWGGRGVRLCPDCLLHLLARQPGGAKGAQGAGEACRGFLVPTKSPKTGKTFLGYTEYARLQPYLHMTRPLEKR